MAFSCTHPVRWSPALNPQLKLLSTVLQTPKRDSVPKAVNIGRNEGRQAWQNRPLSRFQNSKKPVNIGLARYCPKFAPKPGGESHKESTASHFFIFPIYQHDPFMK
jgi:hypothetical protein